MRLRPLTEHDETAALAAQTELAADGFTFLLDHEPGMTWTDYVRRHADLRLGLRLPPDRVRAAFLLATDSSDVVGRVSIRFQLNEFLATQGGHIGYGVRPGFRRRGHATEILRQSLVVARAEGVDQVLVTCDAANQGSATVIQRLDGVETTPFTAPDGTVTRRFWIS